MDKYLKWFYLIIAFALFVWLYVNTIFVNDAKSIANEYNQRVDSLETRIAQLEYLIENEPKQIIVNVNTKNSK